MNKKFLELVKRQAVLAAKSAKDKLSKEEAAELAKISAAIKAATEADEEAATTLKTMTLAEFKAWHEDAVQKIEDGDMDLLPLVKKNLAAVKAQGVTDSEGLVAVELPVEKSEADVIAALEDRIAALEAAKQDDMDGAGEGDEGAGDEGTGDSGDGDGSVEPAAGKQGDKPTAQALAMEAIDTLLEKYGKIKAAIESGELTKDQLDSLWDDWPLKDAIRTSAAIMAKCDELKAAAEAVLPELEKLDDGDGDEGDEGGDGDGDGDEGDGDGDVSKASSAWLGGRDLAAKNQTPEEQASQIRKAKERGRD